MQVWLNWTKHWLTDVTILYSFQYRSVAASTVLPSRSKPSISSCWNKNKSYISLFVCLHVNVCKCGFAYTVLFYLICETLQLICVCKSVYECVDA